MLALLKPWRKLQELKADEEDWQLAFNNFIRNTNQSDKDVIAGCQYFYENKAEGQRFDISSESNNISVSKLFCYSKKIIIESCPWEK